MGLKLVGKRLSNPLRFKELAIDTWFTLDVNEGVMLCKKIGPSNKDHNVIKIYWPNNGLFTMYTDKLDSDTIIKNITDRPSRVDIDVSVIR